MSASQSPSSPLPAAPPSPNPFESAFERLKLEQINKHQKTQTPVERVSVALHSPSAASPSNNSIDVDQDANEDVDAQVEIEELLHTEPPESQGNTESPLKRWSSRSSLSPRSQKRLAEAPDFSSFGSEEENIELPAELQLPPEDVITWKSRGERVSRTLFGAVLSCSCEVYDEVRLTVWLLGLVAGLICLAFFIADNSLHVIDGSDLKLHEHAISIAVGGVFVVASCVLSFIQIKDHLRNYVHPPSQRCVIRILMMVPIYSLSGWLSLVFLRWSLYIDFVRGCYEAFVIYTFMILLTKYLGGHQGVTECLSYKNHIKFPSPFCCLPTVKPTSSFLYYLKYGALQYTISQPILCLIAVVLNTFDLYGDGIIRVDRGYVWISLLQNLSQILALYTLVWLYSILKNELAPFHPMPKFLVVKAVVFFTFWQSVVIAYSVHIGILKGTGEFDESEVQVSLQDFLVTFEMFIAAACHKYTFGYNEYKNGSMKILMDQRAFFLAQKSYAKAVAKARDRENARRIDAGLAPLPNQVSVDASLLPSPSQPAQDNAKGATPGSSTSKDGEDVNPFMASPSGSTSSGGPMSPEQLQQAIDEQIQRVMQRGAESVHDASASVIEQQLVKAGYDHGLEDEGLALYDEDEVEEIFNKTTTFVTSALQRAKTVLVPKVAVDAFSRITGGSKSSASTAQPTIKGRSRSKSKSGGPMDYYSSPSFSASFRTSPPPATQSQIALTRMSSLPATPQHQHARSGSSQILERYEELNVTAPPSSAAHVPKAARRQPSLSSSQAFFPDPPSRRKSITLSATFGASGNSSASHSRSSSTRDLLQVPIDSDMPTTLDAHVRQHPSAHQRTPSFASPLRYTYMQDESETDSDPYPSELEEDVAEQNLVDQRGVEDDNLRLFHGRHV